MEPDTKPALQRLSSNAAKTGRMAAIAVSALLLAVSPLAADAAKPPPEPGGCQDHLNQGRGKLDDETLKICQKEAERGDAEIQLFLGIWYWQNFEDLGKEEKYGSPYRPNGQNDKDRAKKKESAATEAVKWIKKSAGQGLPEAQFILAAVYSQSGMVVQDNEMAFLWVKKAADQGDKGAQKEVAMLGDVPVRPAIEAVDSSVSKNCRRTRIDEDSIETRRACQHAAEKGDIAAQYYVGMMHYFGYGVEKDDKAALAWFTKAAEQGNPVAQYYVGHMTWFGEGLLSEHPEQDREKVLPPQYKESVQWFAKAAVQGDVYAQYALASLYAGGYGLEKNEAAEALRLMKISAENGIPAAQYTLAGMYASGEGAEKDKAEAVKWYKKAADQGHVYAKEALDRMGRYGE